MPITPDRIHQVEMRCTREDGLSFALYMLNPALHVSAGNVDLGLSEPARLFGETGDAALSIQDALRGAPGWLRNVGLWFGPLSGSLTENDREISAKAASALAKGIGSEGTILHVTFPDHALHKYVIAAAFADGNQITLRLASDRG